jgi:bacterioferritin (cytochrome b1)
MENFPYFLGWCIGIAAGPAIPFFIFLHKGHSRKAFGFGLLSMFILLLPLSVYILARVLFTDDETTQFLITILELIRAIVYLIFFLSLRKNILTRKYSYTQTKSTVDRAESNEYYTDNQPEKQFTSNNTGLNIPIGVSNKTIVDKAFLLIEEGKMRQAAEYVNHVLYWEPHNGLAYLARLLIQLNINKKEYLCYYKDLIRDNLDYLRFIKYGDSQDIIEVCGIVEKYKDVDPQLWAKMEDKYRQAIKRISEAEEVFPHGISIYSKEILPLLNSIPNYKDVQQKIRWCNMRIGESVRSIIKTASDYDSNSVSSIERSIDILSEVSDAPEAQLLLNKLNNELEIAKKYELHGFLKWVVWTIIIVVICVWIVGITLAFTT